MVSHVHAAVTSPVFGSGYSSHVSPLEDETPDTVISIGFLVQCVGTCKEGIGITFSVALAVSDERNVVRLILRNDNRPVEPNGHTAVLPFLSLLPFDADLFQPFAGNDRRTAVFENQPCIFMIQLNLTIAHWGDICYMIVNCTVKNQFRTTDGISIILVFTVLVEYAVRIISLYRNKLPFRQFAGILVVVNPYVQLAFLPAVDTKEFTR